MRLDTPLSGFGPRPRPKFELNWTSGFGGMATGEGGGGTGWEALVQGVAAIGILSSMSAFGLIWHRLLFKQSSVVSGRGRERRKINTFLEIRCGFCFDCFFFLQTQIFICSQAHNENPFQGHGTNLSFRGNFHLRWQEVSKTSLDSFLF